MSTEAEPERPENPVDAALREFRNAWYGGMNPDVQEFCRIRPECGLELRARIENFLFVVRSLKEINEKTRQGSQWG